MSGPGARRRIWPVVLGLGVVAVVALPGPLGRMILQQPLAGGPCETPASVEGLDFRSDFNSDNQLVNGSMIRSLADDPSPRCTRIGGSFRCTQAGPTTVEIRLSRGPMEHFLVPAGAEATFFGDAREAFCVITSDAAAG